MRLLLLTLEKHKDGIWITRLLREFQQRIDSKVAVVTVEVVVLEQIGHEVVLVDATATAAVPTFLQHYDGIINRVSDAADPVMVKRCGAILNVARHLLHIPVFNGPTAYALCGNKWCHHVLFHLAKLRAPSTAMIYVSQYNNPSDNDDNGDETTRKESLFDTSRRLLPSHNDPPDVGQQYLIKPNAGGFGNGIVKLNDHHHHNDQNINTEMTTLLPAVNDDTLLLQAYCGGGSGGSNSTTTVTFYRVWFLLGKVQCAVQRRSHTSDTTTDTGSTTIANDTATTTTTTTNAHEFTTGCSARIHHTTESDGSTAATLANTTTTTTLPWAVPEDVRIEIEEQLLPLLPEDGHAGSVEFLTMTTPPRDNHEKDHSPDRYYFDLNLLSTLPIVGGDDDDDDERDDKKSTGSDVWGVHYNPWSELAQGIVSVMLKGTT